MNVTPCDISTYPKKRRLRTCKKQTQTKPILPSASLSPDNANVRNLLSANVLRKFIRKPKAKPNKPNLHAAPIPRTQLAKNNLLLQTSADAPISKTLLCTKRLPKSRFWHNLLMPPVPVEPATTAAGAGLIQNMRMNEPVSRRPDLRPVFGLGALSRITAGCGACSAAGTEKPGDRFPNIVFTGDTR